MAVVTQHLDKVPSRQRRTHTKSRKGCTNCKIRRVKCDENRPTCQKCIAYGVSCDFESPSENALQLTSASSFGVIAVGKLSCHGQISTFQSPCIGQNLPDTHLTRQMHPQDLELLLKFQNQTVLTIGTSNTTNLYRAQMIKLASTKPFLLHLILTLTLMHDRHNTGGLHLPQLTAEAYHWYMGSSLFSEILSRPVQEEDKDALWASASLLGAISFASIRARTIENSWPLSPPSAEDLAWLKMSDGKKAVFKIADPQRPGSVFGDLMPDYCTDQKFISAGDIDLQALPEGFVTMFDLDQAHTKLDSPYYGPLLVLSRLLTIEINHSTILKFLAFIMYVKPEYKNLLETKEPRALLILAWWYALVIPYHQWWVQPRVTLECQAVCTYLDRYHADEVDILQLLWHPKAACGLIPQRE